LISGDLHGYNIEFPNNFAYLQGDPYSSFGKYEFHLPEIKLDHEKKTGTISSYSQANWDGTIEEIFNKFDVAIVPLSASEIATKIASRQCVQLEFKQSKDQKDVPFSVDDPQFCKEFNQKIIDEAMTHASPEAISRYKKFGLELVTTDDVQVSSGPGFLTSHVSYKENNGKMEISSVVLKTDIDYWQETFHIPKPSFIPDPGCFHYCKLLSPARVLEMIYVDGLKGREKGNVKEITVLDE